MSTATVSKPVIDSARARELAVAAGCDPRSIANFMNDRPMRASLVRRIERALAKLDADDRAAAEAAALARSGPPELEARRNAALAAGASPALAEMMANAGYVFAGGTRIGA